MKISPVGNFCSIPSNSRGIIIILLKQTRGERCTLKRPVLNILKSLFFPLLVIRKIRTWDGKRFLHNRSTFLLLTPFSRLIGMEEKKTATNYRDLKTVPRLLITRPPRYWRIQSVANCGSQRTYLADFFFLHPQRELSPPGFPFIAVPCPVPCLKLFLSCVASKVDASIPSSSFILFCRISSVWIIFIPEILRSILREIKLENVSRDFFFRLEEDLIIHRLEFDVSKRDIIRLI